VRPLGSVGCWWSLQALGWSEGRNIQFIYRWSGGDVAHARQFAKELLDLRSDVILTNSTRGPVSLLEVHAATSSSKTPITSRPVTPGRERPMSDITSQSSKRVRA
jgi:hypothetical protein